MQIKKIVVDELPDGCSECGLRVVQDGYPSYYCAGLCALEDKGKIFFGMDTFRRHDCPLVVEEI